MTVTGQRPITKILAQRAHVGVCLLSYGYQQAKTPEVRYKFERYVTGESSRSGSGLFEQCYRDAIPPRLSGDLFGSAVRWPSESPKNGTSGQYSSRSYHAEGSFDCFGENGRGLRIAEWRDQMATKAAEDKLRKPLIFTTSEPRGNQVICAQSTWESHVLKGHPEMHGRLGDVQKAISDPDKIRESATRNDAQIFEYVCSDSVQIRVVATFDDISLMEVGQTTAKMNSAFPVMPEEFDKPHVGNTVYVRPVASKSTGGGK